MDFIVPEANLIPLSFPPNTGLGTDILFIKLELYFALASKKKSILDWHLFVIEMETK